MGSASPQRQKQQQPKGAASTRASPPYSSSSQRRIEEMHRLYEQKLRDRERQRLDLQRLELSECTFTPNISRSSTETILRHRSELNGTHNIFPLGTRIGIYHVLCVLQQAHPLRVGESLSRRVRSQPPHGSIKKRRKGTASRSGWKRKSQKPEWRNTLSSRPLRKSLPLLMRCVGSE